MMLYYGMCSGSDENKAMTENMGFQEGADPVEALGAMPEGDERLRFFRR